MGEALLEVAVDPGFLPHQAENGSFSVQVNNFFYLVGQKTHPDYGSRGLDLGTPGLYCVNCQSGGDWADKRWDAGSSLTWVKLLEDLQSTAEVPWARYRTMECSHSALPREAHIVQRALCVFTSRKPLQRSNWYVHVGDVNADEAVKHLEIKEGRILVDCRVCATWFDVRGSALMQFPFNIYIHIYAL